MVGIQVEKRFKIKNEDIELAIEVNEERLANHDRFRKVLIQLSHRLSFFVNGLTLVMLHCCSFEHRSMGR